MQADEVAGAAASKPGSETKPTREILAELSETLTRPRFHTFCGETHVPGPCNDGVTRLEEDPNDLD